MARRNEVAIIHPNFRDRGPSMVHPVSVESWLANGWERYKPKRPRTVEQSEPNPIAAPAPDVKE